jgi:hypothetical protein
MLFTQRDKYGNAQWELEGGWTGYQAYLYRDG